jgi:hypothetical protein
LSLSVADSVGEVPLEMEVLPVYVTIVGALVTTKVPDPVLGKSVGTVVVSPPNDPLSV